MELNDWYPFLCKGFTLRLRRILVVDDSPMFLTTVVSLLQAADGIEVVGIARSGREALERVKELGPDHVLMDLAMAEVNGFEAARHLAMLPTRPRVIVMTAHAEEAYRTDALEAGADGFLFKSKLNDELVPLIRTLLPECGGEGDQADGQA